MSLQAWVKVTALIIEMRGAFRGVQTGKSTEGTDGMKPGSDWPGWPGSGRPGEAGLTKGVNRVGISCADVQKLILLSTQSINGLYWVSQLCPRTILHSESNGVR